jgi:hypothetical protein
MMRAISFVERRRACRSAEAFRLVEVCTPGSPAQQRKFSALGKLRERLYIRLPGSWFAPSEQEGSLRPGGELSGSAMTQDGSSKLSTQAGV